MINDTDFIWYGNVEIGERCQSSKGCFIVECADRERRSLDCQEICHGLARFIALMRDGHNARFG